MRTIWKRGSSILATILALGLTFPVVAQDAAVDGAEEENRAGGLIDPDLPEYTPVDGVSGSLRSAGSETMNNIVSLWGLDFRDFYRGVSFGVEGKGSSTAPPALIEGQAQFGQMSRPMKEGEIAEFEAAFGWKPHQMRTGIDCIAIFVHKDNPIEMLTLDQLREVFSVDGPDMTWGDLGVEHPDFARVPVALYGRNSVSGTYGFFKSAALDNIDFKETVKEQAGSAGVVNAVGEDRFGMGYCGVGKATSNVRIVPVAIDDYSDPVTPNAETALTGEYPLARYLLLYINKNPNQALDPVRREFARLIFSRQGQEAVYKDGFIPLPASVARNELERLGIEPGF